MAMSGDNTLREFPVIDGNTVHDPDDLNKIKHVIQATKEDTEIFPHLNNYNATDGDLGSGDRRAARGRRKARRACANRSCASSRRCRPIAVCRSTSRACDDRRYPLTWHSFRSSMRIFTPRNLRLYVNVPAAAEDDYLKQIAPNSDGIVLMNYDQHEMESDPGPIAAQDWFVANLPRVLKSVPKEKLICAIGNYGYDWTLSIPDPKDRKHPKPKVIDAEESHVSEVWQRASDADADLEPRLRHAQSAL